MKSSTVKNTLDLIVTTVVTYTLCTFIGQKMGEGWLKRIEKRSQDESVKREISEKSDEATSETL